MRRIVWQIFGNTSLSGRYRTNPPVLDPIGGRKISLDGAATPMSRPSYRIRGERLSIHKRLLKDVIASGEVEPGSGPWN